MKIDFYIDDEDILDMFQETFNYKFHPDDLELETRLLKYEGENLILFYCQCDWDKFVETMNSIYDKDYFMADRIAGCVETYDPVKNIVYH